VSTRAATAPVVARRNGLSFRPGQPGCPGRPGHWRRRGSAGSWVCARGAGGPVAALTRSPGRRAMRPPGVQWPGRLPLAAAQRAARLVCRCPGPRARRPHQGRRRLAACPRTKSAAQRHQPPGAGQAPSLPGLGVARVRRWCPHRVPADARGRVRSLYRAPDDRPVPTAVAPGHWRAEGHDSPVARLPRRPGHRDVGVVRVAVTCAFTAMARTGRRPGTGGLLRGTGRGPVVILWGWPGQAGAVRRRFMSGWLCGYRCGPVRRPVAAGIPGAVGMAWREWLAGRAVSPAGSR
jgi:hypothetical protein